MSDEGILRGLDPEYDLAQSLRHDGRPMYYDRDGRPIGTMEWARLHRDPTYLRVDRTVLAFSNGIVEVSTVWLGIDHAWLGGPPILFETMVFGGRWHQWQWRYGTEVEARAGHLIVTDAVRLDRRPS